MMIDQPITDGLSMSIARRGRPMKAVVQEDRSNKSLIKTICGVLIARSNSTLNRFVIAWEEKVLSHLGSFKELPRK